MFQADWNTYSKRPAAVHFKSVASMSNIPKSLNLLVLYPPSIWYRPVYKRHENTTDGVSKFVLHCIPTCVPHPWIKLGQFLYIWLTKGWLIVLKSKAWLLLGYATHKKSKVPMFACDHRSSTYHHRTYSIGSSSSRQLSTSLTSSYRPNHRQIQQSNVIQRVGELLSNDNKFRLRRDDVCGFIQLHVNCGLERDAAPRVRAKICQICGWLNLSFRTSLSALCSTSHTWNSPADGLETDVFILLSIARLNEHVA